MTLPSNRTCRVAAYLNKALHATPSPFGLGPPHSLRSFGARERQRWSARSAYAMPE